MNLDSSRAKRSSIQGIYKYRTPTKGSANRSADNLNTTADNLPIQAPNTSAEYKRRRQSTNTSAGNGYGQIHDQVWANLRIHNLSQRKYKRWRIYDSGSGGNEAIYIFKLGQIYDQVWANLRIYNWSQRKYKRWRI